MCILHTPDRQELKKMSNSCLFFIWLACMQLLWTTSQRAEFYSSTEPSSTVTETVASFRNPPACVKVCTNIICLCLCLQTHLLPFRDLSVFFWQVHSIHWLKILFQAVWKNNWFWRSSVVNSYPNLKTPCWVTEERWSLHSWSFICKSMILQRTCLLAKSSSCVQCYVIWGMHLFLKTHSTCLL